MCNQIYHGAAKLPISSATARRLRRASATLYERLDRAADAIPDLVWVLAVCLWCGFVLWQSLNALAGSL